MIGVYQGGQNDWNVWHFFGQIQGNGHFARLEDIIKIDFGVGEGGVQGWVDWGKCLSHNPVTDVGMSVVPTEGGGRRNQRNVEHGVFQLCY
jgi:hypothetical protein